MKRVLFGLLLVFSGVGADVNIGGLATGQTTSYQSGDDGDLQKGTPRSFTRDDTTEIVTDNVTGLMWQDDAAAASIQKPWLTQENYDAKDYFDTSGDTATTYCSDLSLGGYDDWRLPSVKELLSIVDNSKHLPATFNAFINNASDPNNFDVHYWSSTTSKMHNNKVWNVSMNNGNLVQNGYVFFKNDSYYIRCVRSGKSTPEDSNFIKNIDNNIVIDSTNNLYWHDDATLSPTQKSWSEAITYCEDLNLSGYTDWYLPNKNQFLSVIDYSKEIPATFSAFEHIASIGYWSSSTYSSNTGDAWGVSLYLGETNRNNKADYNNIYGGDNMLYVQCVHDGELNFDNFNVTKINYINEDTKKFYDTLGVYDANNSNISVYSELEAFGSVNDFWYGLKDEKLYITSNSNGDFDVMLSIGDHKKFIPVTTAYLPSASNSSTINSSGQLDDMDSATTIQIGTSYNDSITYVDNSSSNARVIKFNSVESNQEYKLLFRFDTSSLISSDGASITMELYKDGVSLGTKSFTPNDEYAIPLVFDDSDAHYMISLTPNDKLIQAKYEIGLMKNDNLLDVDGYYYYKKYTVDENGLLDFDIVLPKDKAYKFEWVSESDLDLNLTTRGESITLSNNVTFIEKSLRAGIYTLNAKTDVNSSFYLMISDSSKLTEFERNDNIFGANNYYGTFDSNLNGNEKDFYIFKSTSTTFGATLGFTNLPSDSYLTLELYDIAGNKLKTNYLTSISLSNVLTFDGIDLTTDNTYYFAISKSSDENTPYILTINNASNVTLQKEQLYTELYNEVINSSATTSLNENLELVLDESSEQKDPGQLLILTGDSDNPIDALYPASQKLSLTAYNRFNARGLNDNDIYWINGEDEVDLDSDGKLDNVVDSTTLTATHFYSKISDWATNSSNNGPLYIYMVDHGTNGAFKVSANAGNDGIIYETDLKSTLDTFTSTTNRDVVLIMEACKSGSFADSFANNDKISFIASSKAGELSYIDSSGSVSFTKLFFDNILAGSNISTSYTNAEASLKALGGVYTKQNPVSDISAAMGSISVGGSFAAASMSLTSIDSVSVNGTATTSNPNIDVTTSKDIAIETSITAASGIAKVWATVITPDFTPPSITTDGYEVADLDPYTVELTYNTSDAIYEGTYTISTTSSYSGDYHITVYVEDLDGLVYNSKVTLSGTGELDDPNPAGGGTTEPEDTNTTDPSEDNTNSSTENNTTETGSIQTVNISQGWNLVALPVDTSIDQSSLNSKFSTALTLWQYSNGWKAHGTSTLMQDTLSNAGINSIDTIVKGDGFWVNNVSADTIEFSGNGYDITSNSKLTSASSGWHLLGSGSSVSVKEISNSNTNINTIWAYDNGWQAYSPNSATMDTIKSAGILELENIDQGQGFWVNIK